MTYLDSKVLIADDDRAIRALLRFYLSEQKIDASVVSGGQEALAEFEKGGMSVVIVDYEMQVMNGVETCAAMREFEAQHNLKPIPILLLSAHVADNGFTLPAGFTGAVAKPFTKQTILEAVKIHLPEANGFYQKLPTALKPLLPKLNASFAEALEETQAALHVGNFEAGQEQAHKIKGAALTFEIEHIGSIAYELEIACEAHDAALANALLAQLAKTIEGFKNIS